MELSSLKPLFARPGPWASIYLDTSRTTEDARRLHELRIREVAERLAEQDANSDTREAVVTALSPTPVSSESVARALFATGGEVVFNQPLTAAPPVVEATWAPLPRVAPLLDLADEGPLCLVAHLDRIGARLELWAPFAREPEGEVTGKEWPVHRTGRDTWSERHFQFKVENTWEHNAGVVADELARRWPHLAAELLVLAGEPRERRMVHERLPVPLRAVAFETGRDPDDERITQLREAWNEARLAEVLDQFRAERGRPGQHSESGGPPGRAAEGVPAVTRAARNRQVEALLVRPGAGDTGRAVWIGPEPDQIAVQRREIQAMGVAAPKIARADDALLRSAVASGAEVFALPEDAEGSGPAGGVGAVLRWRDRSEPGNGP